MLNTFVLEGKLKEVSSIKETDRGTKFMKILIECERNFRNNENIIETDLGGKLCQRLTLLKLKVQL